MDDHSNQKAGATLMNIGGVYSGNISLLGDVDYFKIELVKDDRYFFEMNEARTGSIDNVFFKLEGPAGTAGATASPNATHTAVPYTAEVSGSYYLVAREYGDNGKGTYTVQATKIEQDDHSDNRTGGTSLEIGRSVTGEIDVTADRDWFKVDLKSGTNYIIEMKSDGEDPLDISSLSLFNASGLLLGKSVGSGSATISYAAKTDGVHYISANALGDNSTGVYAIHVRSSGSAQPTNGHDKISGTIRNDALKGLGGNDTIDGGLGADTMDGGAGNDVYYVDNVGDRVIEGATTSFSGGLDTVYSSASRYTLSSYVENAHVLSVLSANLTGNSSNNVIYAGKGSNILAGGAGSDTLSYQNGITGTSGVKVSLAITTAQSTIGSGIDTISSFERLIGSNNNDTLYGNSGANYIFGKSGKDQIVGGGGNDFLFGDLGNDVLRGGSGNDFLTGGVGKDSFVFDSRLTTATLSNLDTIRDFSVADDTIRMDNKIFTSFGNTTGVMASKHFRANFTGSAVDQDDYILYEKDTGKVFYDADGSGALEAVQIALIGKSLALTSEDFVLF